MSLATTSDVFFLGAGKPAAGDKPAALRDIGIHTRALDWQLHSLTPLPQPKTYFLGGYHIEEIIASYPQLHYVVVPQWQKHSIIHSLLKAPWRPNTTFVLYADTVFRPNVLHQVHEITADIVLVYDSNWRHRYENRQLNDIALAEIISIHNGNLQWMPITPSDASTMEFTGLLKLSPEVSALIGTLSEEKIGRNLIDLIHYLALQGFSIKAIDAEGAWTEFNSPLDIAHFVLGTKAETLNRLAPLVKKSIIGQQYSCTVTAWREAPQNIIDAIMQKFPATRIVIRSSAKSEDNWSHSNAGSHTSILNIDSTAAEDIANAITQVVNSYKTTANCHDDQVLVQEFLAHVQCAGVVFTRVLETGAPYYRINFDDISLSTESVTAGNSNNLRTILVSRASPASMQSVAPELLQVLSAVSELETLLDYDRLDIEFAIDKHQTVHIFQVRPMTVDHSAFEIEDAHIYSALQECVSQFKRMQVSTPFVVGAHTLFGIMPDWNPAEIIGTRPRPLSFSLYRYLITDDIWAKQRAEFGYRDVRPHPLLVAFCGQPYVDIRASLNSFVPATVSSNTAEKLVEAYLAVLTAEPHLHDKLEFRVAFTVWTPTLIEEAEGRLIPLGITNEQIHELAHSLKVVTRHALTRLETDTASIRLLDQRRHAIIDSPLPSLDKAIVLLDDCQRFGTLAFAHAARAGFVAVSFLNSFVKAGILSFDEKQHFQNSIKTIAGEFEENAHKVANEQLGISEYYAQYGHLRPGTYDITMSAYWELPDRYLLCKTQQKRAAPKRKPFTFSNTAQDAIARVITELGSHLSLDAFTQYLVAAIQAREWVKFKFTYNLSRALDYCVEYGHSIGLSRDDISYLQFDELKQLKSGHLSVSALSPIIKKRKKMMQLTHMIELPQLLLQENNFYCFERMAAQPNFITTKCVTAPAMTECNKNNVDLHGYIILVPQADPGYDWLFAHDIAGLVTRYGGANSHMAIRAAEMGLPAAIGVGDKLYEELCKANYLHLDCALQQIRGLA